MKLANAYRWQILASRKQALSHRVAEQRGWLPWTLLTLWP
jgi:hypothetical protein